MKATANLALIAAGVALFVPLSVLALVNINTADSAELDTLPGIGPAKAQDIIDYRTGPQGPFNTKEELMDVDGIGQATYDGLKDLITIGSESSSEEEEEEAEEEETEEEPEDALISESDRSSTRRAPMKTLKIVAGQHAVAGAGSRLAAQAYNDDGEPIYFGARYRWNFGDGTVGDEKESWHVYAYPGTYSVRVSATYKGEELSARSTITVVAPQLVLRMSGDGSIEIINKGKEEIDVGNWIVADQGATFRLPADTYLAGLGSLRLAAAVTGLEGSAQARLLFPNGGMVALPAAPKAVAKTSALPKIADAPVAAASAAPSAALQNSPVAAVAGAPISAAAWLPYAGLVAVIAVGMAGVYYARTPGPVTKQDADGFDIE